MKHKADGIARCLNELCTLNLGGITSTEELSGLIEDYFLNDEEDIDQDSSDEELEGILLNFIMKKNFLICSAKCTVNVQAH
jgi:hypothetical protein